MTVTTSCTPSASIPFTIDQCLPEPGLIEPAVGDQGSTLSVRIYGDYLSGATLSNDCGISIQNVVSSQTRINTSFTIPPGVAIGSCNITITTCTSSLPLTFTIHPGQAGAAPVINAPDDIREVRNGSSSTIRIEGSNLNGDLTVSIPTDSPSESGQPRVFPTVGIGDNDPLGRWVDILVEAHDTRILGFYNLVISNGVGSNRVIVRVLPNEAPVADSWNPQWPDAGHAYAFTIVGKNLQGAQVRPLESDKLEVLDPTTGPERIVGILVVNPTAPIGPTYLLLENAGGSQLLQVNICRNGVCPTGGAVVPSRVDINLTEGAGSGAEAMPPLYFQSGEDAFAISEELSAGMPVDIASYSCYIYRNLANLQWEIPLISCPSRGQWGSKCLEGLSVGDRIRIGGMVIAFYFRLDIQVSWRSIIACIPASWPTICSYISSGIETVNNRTWAIAFNYCIRRGAELNGNLGTLNGLDLSSTGCINVIQDPSLTGGVRYATAEYLGCCTSTIQVSATGTGFRNLLLQDISGAYRPLERSFSFQNVPVARYAPPAETCSTEITEVDLCARRIRIRLSPAGATGTFTLNVIKSDNTRTALVSGAIRQGGTYDDVFTVDDLSVGSYSSIEAVWEVGGVNYSATRPYAMEVLDGNYLITCYITASENDWHADRTDTGCVT